MGEKLASIINIKWILNRIENWKIHSLNVLKRIKENRNIYTAFQKISSENLEFLAISYIIAFTSTYHNEISKYFK